MCFNSIKNLHLVYCNSTSPAAGAVTAMSQCRFIDKIYTVISNTSLGLV